MAGTKHTALKVHSGNCCLCEVGIETGATDASGLPVHTGDIVSLYSLLNRETDEWDLTRPLTVVVANQFTSYSDGTVCLNAGPLEFFTMGIKSEGISSPEWRVVIVKKFNDVVPGEHWPGYGFSYRENPAADTALAAKAEGSSHG